MSSLVDFFQSTPFLAFVIAILIFLTTILLVVKRWIGFPVTLLLLLFSLVAGLIINHQQIFQDYLDSHSPSSNSTKSEDSQEAFHRQVLQAIEDLKLEVNTERENLQHVLQQIQEIFHSMEAQKQKLQHFIEETQERFKTDYPIKDHSDKKDSSSHLDRTL